MVSFIGFAVVMVSLHSNRTVTKTEVVMREQDIVITGLTMLLIGRIWTSILWIRKTVECFKWDLMLYLVEA